MKDVISNYTVNRQKSTKWVERRNTKHLMPAFGGRRLSSITTRDLRAFAARRLEAKASPAAINWELALMRRAFRLAVEHEKYHGRIPTFPMLAEDTRERDLRARAV